MKIFQRPSVSSYRHEIKKSTIFLSCGLIQKGSIFKSPQSLRLFILLIPTLCILVPESSFAGTEGSELDDLADKIKGFIEGTGGQVITFCSIAVSAVAAFQQKMTAVFGAAAPALICQFGPGIAEATITALI